MTGKTEAAREHLRLPLSLLRVWDVLLWQWADRTRRPVRTSRSSTSAEASRTRCAKAPSAIHLVWVDPLNGFRCHDRERESMGRPENDCAFQRGAPSVSDPTDERRDAMVPGGRRDVANRIFH